MELVCEISTHVIIYPPRACVKAVKEAVNWFHFYQAIPLSIAVLYFTSTVLP